MAPTERATTSLCEARNLVVYPDPPAAERVRALIMQDSRGEVQVIVPERALLDLAALTELCGRDLRARPYRLEAGVCAVPGFYGLPVLLDQSLTQAGKLALASEDPGVYFAATGADLTTSGQPITTGRLTQAIGPEPTPDDRGGDLERIGATLSRFTAQRLQQRLDQTLHIPPMPDAAQRIVALQSDPNYDLEDLVQIIETDPSIAARIMGWANSAFYHPSPPASSIGDAVMRVLGFDTVMSMALGMALGQTLRLPDAEVRGLPSFWLDAVFTAATMEALARQMPRAGRPLSGLCYITGLLANFGTLVVGHTFPHQYATICRLQEANRHLPHTYVDDHVLQMPRELICAALLECWALPGEVTDAVRFQYVPNYTGSNATYVRLLRLARKLLGSQGLTDEPPTALQPGELEALGLSDTAVGTVMSLLNDSREQMDDFASTMGR